MLLTFQVFYQAGVDAYAREDWQAVTKNMEEALLQYFKEYDRCRLLCEGPYEHDRQSELYNVIASEYEHDRQSELYNVIVCEYEHDRPSELYNIIASEYEHDSQSELRIWTWQVVWA